MNTILDHNIHKRHLLFMIGAASLFQIGNIVISGALAEIARVFPDSSAMAIQLLMTLPDFAIICSTLLAGKLASRIQPRTMVLAGLACYVVTGLGGLLFHQSMGVIYIWSFVLGIGRGFWITMISYYITVCFEETDRARGLSVQNTYNNAGGIALTILGGLLSNVAWFDCYIVYLLVIPVLVAGWFWLPKGIGPTETKRTDSCKAAIHPCVYVFALCGFLFLIIYNVYLTNVSMLFDELGFASVSTMAGVANGFFMAGGAVAAVFFGRMSRHLGDRLIPLGFASMALGLFLSFVTKSMPLIMLGGMIAGSGMSFFAPQVNMTIARKSDPSQLSFSVSIFLASLYVGGFCSAPIITPLTACFSESVRSRFVLGAVLSLTFTLIVFILIRSSWVKAETDEK